MGLKKYNQKRNFKKTPEPPGRIKKTGGKKLAFVIQKHHARRLHYDFRLEFDGTLKSWAVPKGPSFDPSARRLAVEVEDHPVSYGSFEGEIPVGEYGAGQVIVWDNGTWQPVNSAGVPLRTDEVTAALKKGHLDFELDGHKLRGGWSLIRMGRESDKNNWLLLKRRDGEARTGFDVTVEEPDSVLRKRPRAKAALKKTAKKTARKAAARRGTKSGTGGKKKADPPPDFVKPQLAQLVSRVPDGTQWVHEIKFDGYRTLCRINGDDIRFVTRNNHDWTARYKQLIPAAQKLNVQNALLDGEVVCLNEDGHSDFQKLQNSLAGDSPARLYYYVFDLLFLDGEDLREMPLLERKKRLKALLKPLKKSAFLFSEHWAAQGDEMYRESCRLKLEGVVSKDAQASYMSGRSALWQKTKCSLRQEFVIGGFTESAAEGRPFAALLLGVFDDDGRFRYTGRTGTGFTAASLAELAPRLHELERDRSPFDVNSPRGRTLHWVKPQLVAEVEFKAWTQDKVLRMASFQGLRQDKQIHEVHMEKPARKTPQPAGKAKTGWPKSAKSAAAAGAAPSAKGDAVAGVRISHPDRIVYPDTGTRKLDVVRYYEAVAPWMLPYLQDRPLSILRCQETTAAGCYFQKHAEGRNLVGIGSKPVHYKDKRDTALVVRNTRDLIRLAQAGTIEVHGWNGRFRHITKPDQIVFDLDPETGKLWSRVVDTAFEIRDMLKRLGLESFLKVTGGKGLHIQVPIAPRYSWDEIKSFSKSLMDVLVQRQPAQYTTNMTKANRGGKIFLDYLRNGYGATAVIPFSLRARVEPTVALPISWRELKASLSPDDFLYDDVLKLLKHRGEPGGAKDPWAGYFDLPQRIAVLEKKSQGRDTEAWPRM